MEPSFIPQDFTQIVGTDGRDILSGSDQNSQFWGKSGRDLLIGGIGVDRFVYTALLDGPDIIQQFDLERDQIVLTDLLAGINYLGTEPFADGVIQVQPYGGDSVVLIDPDGTLGDIRARAFLLVQGIEADDLLSNPNNFVLTPEVMDVTVSAGLTDDTGASATDGLTFNANIAGSVNQPLWVQQLLATLNDGDPIDITEQLQADGTFKLSPDTLAGINGGSLDDGIYTLKLQAIPTSGQPSDVFSLPFQLDTTAPAITLGLLPNTDSAPIGDQQTTFETIGLLGKTESGVTVNLLPQGDSAQANATGEFTFDGLELPVGSTAFSVSVTDLAGNQASATTVVERIVPLNQPPIVASDKTILVSEDSAPVALDISAPSDPDGDTLVITVDAIPENEKGFIQLSDGSPVALGQTLSVEDFLGLNFVPVPDANGNAGLFRYNVDDGQGETTTQTTFLLISPVNDAPVLTVPDLQSVPEGTTLLIPGVSVDDLDAAEENVQVALSATGGLLSLGETQGLTFTDGDDGGLVITGTLPNINAALSTLTYQSVAGFTGGDGINITVDDLGNVGDGNPLIASATVPIEVTPAVNILLREGSNFQVLAEETIDIPQEPSVLSFSFTGLDFDLSDEAFINDAFEASLVDQDGNSLVHTIGEGQTAFFNITEGLEANLATGVTFDGQTVQVNLAGVEPGKSATLILQLVNNDSDQNTSVNITQISLLAGDGIAPVGLANNTDSEATLQQIDFGPLSDVSTSLQPRYGETSWNPASQVLTVDLALLNAGTYSINGPLLVAVTDISDPSVQIVGADGITPEGLPYFDFTALIDQALSPEALTDIGKISFQNTNGGQFTYSLVVLANTNTLPVIDSVPVLEIIGGQPYTYQLIASDPNEDALTYELVTAPAGMTIDSTTGFISWDTTLEDIANHAVTVRVSDGRGGAVEQTFTLAVIAEPPNRPPLFTSTPVVDAQINQLYSYDSDAIDPDQDLLTYSLVIGPDGMTVDPVTGQVLWTPPPVLALGDTVLGQNSLPGDSAEFSFSGVAGQRIYLDSLQGFSGSRTTIYSPNGTIIKPENGLLSLTESGNYRIVSDSSGDTTGSYGFSLIDPALLPEAPFDTIVEGQLSPGSEDDLFRFNGFEGQKIFLDQLSNSGRVKWQLLDEGNRVVAEDSLMRDLELYLPKDGEYILALQGQEAFSTVINYAFEIVTPDEITAPISLGNNDILNGITGRISEPGEEDFFTFEGSVGQQVYLDRLNPINNGNLKITIESPTGREYYSYRDRRGRPVRQSFVSGHEWAPVTLIEDGLYQVRIDGEGDNLGDYSFSLRNLEQATTINLDQQYSGALDPGEASHLYQFTSQANQRLFIDYQDNSGTGSNDRTRWTLYNSGNQEVESNYTGQYIEVVLDKDDIYTLAIEGNREDIPVEYSFKVITPDDISTPLLFNTVTENAIGEKGEQDIFTFEGQKGQRIALDVIGSSFNTSAKIIGPSGNTILSNSPFLSDREIWWYRNDLFPTILPEDGRYQLVIDGFNGSTDDYSFQLLDIDSAPELEGNNSISETLQPGQSSKLYQFSAKTGDSLYLDVNTASQSLYTHIFGPSNQLIGRTYYNRFGNQLDQEHILPGDGTYYILVRGESNEPIDYDLKIFLNQAPPKAVSFNNLTIGTISEPGQQQTYTFEGSLGQKLIFDSMSGSTNLLIDIRNASGNVIYSSNTTADSDLLNLPEAGIYTITINGTGDATGDYSFTLRNDTSALALGVRINGTLEAREIALYEFEGILGTTLNFDSLNAVNGAEWILYSPDGTEVTRAELDEDLIQALPATGTYFLALRNNSDSVLNYSFQANDVSPASVTPSGLNQDYVGEISAAGEVDRYTIAANAGALVYFNGKQGNSSYLRPILRSPNGSTVFNGTSTSSDYGPYLIEQTGNYSLDVYEVGNWTGSYGFELIDLRTSASDVALGDSLEITLASKEAQVFKFTGSLGQKILLDGLNTENLDISARIIDQSGRQIASTNTTGNTGLITLKMDGDYYVLLDSNSSQPQIAQLRLLDWANATLISPNTIVSGNFGDTNHEAALFKFTATKGQTAYVDRIVGGTSQGWQGNSNNTYTIYSPDGTKLFDQYLLRDYEIAELSADGEYLLALFGNGDAENDYEFKLVIPTDELAVIDFSDAITGEIREPGQTNTYTFTATENQRLIFDALTQADNSNQIAARIYSPSGRQVLGYNFWQKEPNAVTLREAGTYRVVIDGNEASTSTYGFRLLDFADAPEVSLDTPFEGNVGASRQEVQLYKFTGEAGQRIFFDRQTGSSQHDYALYAPDGKVLFEQRLHKDYQLTALPTDGEYTLTVIGSGSGGSEFKFNLVTPINSTSDHVLGETISGEISEPGESDYYTFTGEAGQVLWFDSLLDSDNIYAYLDKPSGERFGWNRFDQRQDVGSEQRYSNAFTIALDKSGTYRFVIDADGDATGSYAFRFLDLRKAPEVEVDTEISGKFETGKEAFAYRFTAPENARLFFDRSSGGGQALYYLYDSSGQQIFYQNLSVDQELTTPPLEKDTQYYLVVAGNNPVGSKYTFEIVTPEFVTQSYTLGDTISGDIGEAGEQDWYTFEGTVGLQILIDWISGESDELKPVIKAPSGRVYELYEWYQSVDDDSKPFTLSETGIFTIKINPSGDIAPGEYSFRVLDIATVEELSFNTPISSDADMTDLESQVYRFSGEQGDRIYFDGEGSGTYSLYQLTGEKLISNRSIDRDEDYIIPEIGDYLLVLSGDGSGANTYTMEVVKTELVETSIELGQVLTGEISKAGQRDIYRFDGQLGQQIFLDALGQNEGLDIELRTPSGQLILSSKVHQDQGPITLTEDGTYRLTVDGTYNWYVGIDRFNTGSYSLALSDLSQASKIEVGQPTSGSLTPGSSVALYQFEGSQGTTLSFDLAAEQWNGANWVLYAPGNEVIAQPASQSPDFNVALSSNGQYTLIVQGSSDLAVDYEFTVTDTTVPAIENTGFNEVQSGAITTPGQVDRYSFEATAGTLAFFDSHEALGAGNLRFSVLNPDGSTAFSNAFLPQDRAPDAFSLTQTGAYTLEIYGSNSTGTGNYQFQVLELPADFASPNSLPLDFGTPIDGTLSEKRSAIAYSFSGSVGETIYFNGIQGNNITARLYSPNGTELLSYSNVRRNDIGPHTLNQEGTYHWVLQSTQDNPADYEFQLIRFDGARQLGLNQPTSGRLASGWQQKIYQFDGKAGRELFLDSLTNSSNRWKIYGPDHQLLMDSRLRDDFRFTLPREGTYTLVVGGNQAAELPYQFTLYSIPENERLEQLVPGTGETGSNDDSALGSFAVTLQAEDGVGGTASQSYQIRLLPDPDNSAPKITSAPKTVFGLNQDFYQYQLDALDPDGDDLAFRLVDAPLGSLIDGDTGALFWFPESDIGAGGTYGFTVEVDDGRGGIDRQTFSVDVFEALGEIRGSVFEDLNRNGYRDSALVEGENPYILFAVDNSGSMAVTLDGDRPNGSGINLLDPNFDLSAVDENSLSRQDFQYATLVALAETLIEQGRGENVNIGLKGISGDALIDMEPDTPGFQAFTTLTADNDNDGISDYREGITELSATPGQSLLGNSNGAIAKAIADTLPDDSALNFYFMTDGAIDFDLGAIEELTNNPKVNTKYFGISEFSRLYFPLDENATKLSSIEQAVNIFTGWDEELATEPLMEQVTVYLDLNDNGQLDNDEPRQITTDEVVEDLGVAYQFVFDSLVPGDYTIRQVIPAGYQQTTPDENAFVHTVTPEGGEDERFRFGNYQTAEPPNRNPVFTSEAPPSVIAAGKSLLYQAIALDPDSEAVIYDLPLGPEGMVIDPETGALFWSPTSGQVGETSVIVRARDGRGGFALQSFGLTVTPPNETPLFTSTPKTTTPQIGKPFQYNANATDPDDDPITYELAPGAPDGITVDANTGILTWTATPDQLGEHEIVLIARDDNGAETTQPLALTVIEPQTNTAPQITSQPRVTTRTNAPYLYQLAVSDLDGDPLTFTLVDGPDGMTIDETGLIAWEPVASQTGAHLVTIAVEDGQGGSDTQTYNLRVGNQAANLAPEITSEPAYLTNRDRFYQYQATAADPDSDALFWELVDAPEGMVVDAQTGVVSWQPDFTQVGEHTITLQATDTLGAFATQTFTLQVRGTNTPPQITSTPPTQIGTEQPYRYQIEATDIEGDRITYKLGTHPEGMTIDAATGELVWTPEADQLGNHEVELRVQDSQGGVGSQTYTLVVTSDAVNQAPTITSTPGFWADVANGYQYQLTASDPDGDTLSYSVLAGPTGMTVDPTTGLLQWQPTLAQLGEQTITVAAFDSFGLGVLQSYSLQVAEANKAPVIRSTPILSTPTDTTYRYDVWASDPEGEPITLNLNEGPDGMVMDELGRITWSVDATDLGTYPVEIAVTDSRGAVTLQSFNLEVQADTIAPRVDLQGGEAQIEVDSTVTLKVSASDNVGVEFLQLTVNGEAIALDSQGIATVTLDEPGSFDVVATATDAAGNVGTATSTLFALVSGDPGAPIVDLISLEDGEPFTTLITAPTDIIGTVTDDNLLYYTLEVAPAAGGEYTEIYRGTGAVENGFLGEFDPTLLLNDTYRLRLSATDAGGNIAYDETLVEVTGELKLGNFQLSFTDLTVPVSGIPIQVTRTYDSLTTATRDDFGYGWRMEFRDTDLRTSLGPDPELEALGIASKGFAPGDRVYITLPGGERQGFTFQPKPAPLSRYIPAQSLQLYTPEFVPDPGVETSLSVHKVNLIQLENGEFASLNGGRYNPANELYGFGGYYDLTTKEGIVYRIDALTGDLETITDRNNNTLSFTDSDITSSTGQKVTFERDAQNRITAVIDPEGNRITYDYDALGDLVAVTDREGNTTRFDYNDDRAHYLEEIIDPLGRSGVRSEYDDQGRLTRMIDADGNPVELIYDPDNDIQQVRDQLGNVTTYEYDDRGNVVSEVDALGGITRRTYDSDNNMLTETDPLGNTTTMTYDADGNVLTETDALGNVTRYTYDANGNVLTTTDPTGQTITNLYDANGNLTQIAGQASGPLSFSYDASGNLTAMEDGSGTTSFEYDALGNITRQTDAAGTVTSFTYDPSGNRTSETTTQTLADGSTRTLVTQMEYDDEGRVIRTINAEGGVTETIYDAVGNRIEEIDALGRSTKYLYDDRGQLIATIYPDSTPDDDSDNPRTQTEYDAKGQVIAEIDELGRRTVMIYDALGRQITTLYPDATPNDDSDNPRTQTVYDAAGRVVAEIDELGNRTEFVYDAAGRVIETILPDETPADLSDNPRFTTAYDAAGRQLTQTDALGQVTQFLYDDLGRPVGQVYADGTSTSVEFDDAGRVAARTDQAGLTTRYEYDALGRLTAVVDALDQRTEYTYDEQGNLITQTDANGNTTRYEYDRLGRRVATELPLGERATSTYDAVGNMRSTTDFNGDTKTYTYDERNRLIAKDLPGTEFDETHTYTANGLRQTVTDDRGTTTYQYDERNRLISRIDPDGTTIAYTYDAAGNRTSVQIPSGTTEYGFDAQNRLKTVTDPEGGVTTYTYNPVGNLERTEFPNGTVETREYDDLNRLVYIETSGPEGVIASFRYTLDDTGNRTAVEEHDGRRVDYEYDDLYRLTAEIITDPGSTGPSRIIDYVYDAVGNRLSRTDTGEGTTLYTYDDNDRLLTATTDGDATTYTYDNNGNTTSKTADGTTVTYAWNADNRLIGADTDGDGEIDVVNQYNENGIRVSQTVNGEETRFLIDANRPYAQVLEEYTPGGIIKVSYVHGNDLISQNREGERSLYHVDGLGSTRALSDEDGLISDQYIYDAFGQIITRTGDTENSYFFAGEQRDKSINADYLRARLLDFSAGRFVSRDSFRGFPENPLSNHRYLYGNGNPASNIDPSGLFSIKNVLAGVAVAQSLAAISGVTISAVVGDPIVESEITTVNYNELVGANLFNSGVPWGLTIVRIVTEEISHIANPDKFVLIGGFIDYAAAGRTTNRSARDLTQKSSINITKGSTVSPGVFFQTPDSAKTAFTGATNLFSIGGSVGGAGRVSGSFGGGTIGFSVVNMSGPGGSYGSGGGAFTKFGNPLSEANAGLNIGFAGFPYAETGTKAGVLAYSTDALINHFKSNLLHLFD